MVELRKFLKGGRQIQRNLMQGLPLMFGSKCCKHFVELGGHIEHMPRWARNDKVVKATYQFSVDKSNLQFVKHSPGNLRFGNSWYRKLDVVKTLKS